MFGSKGQHTSSATASNVSTRGPRSVELPEVASRGNLIRVPGDGWARLVIEDLVKIADIDVESFQASIPNSLLIKSGRLWKASSRLWKASNAWQGLSGSLHARLSKHCCDSRSFGLLSDLVRYVRLM